MALVYLLRHGDYEHEDSRSELMGQGLTTRGRQQAIAAGKWLASSIDREFLLISSDFTRAKETADLIANEAQPGGRVVDPDLRECGDTYYKTLDATDSRPSSAFSRLMALGAVQHSVAICHANLIRYILARAGKWSARRWQARIIPLCSLSVLSVPSDPSQEVSVEAVAKVGHLPRELRDRY